MSEVMLSKGIAMTITDSAHISIREPCVVLPNSLLYSLNDGTCA